MLRCDIVRFVVVVVLVASACGGEAELEADVVSDPAPVPVAESGAQPEPVRESGVSGGGAVGEDVLEAQYFERLAAAVASLDPDVVCPDPVLPESFDDVVEVGRIAGGCLLIEYVALGGRSVGEVREELAEDPSVFAVGVPPVDLEPLQSGGLSDVASLPQWHLEPMGAEFLWRPGGWEYQLGGGPWHRVPGWPVGKQVVVAVIDDGVDGSHRDLQASLLDPDTLPASAAGAALSCHRSPTRDHGTHVAGIIAATQGNGVDVAGLAPRATILPIRIHYTANFADPANKTGPDSQACFDAVPTLTHAINLARRSGADVINMSLRWNTREFEVDEFEDTPEFVTPGLRTETVALAIDVARQEDNVVVVAAAGNCGDDRIYENRDTDGDGQFERKANGDLEWFRRVDQSDISGTTEPGWKVINECNSHHAAQRPAVNRGVIAVAATAVYDPGDSDIRRAVFSSSNHTVDVAAPGSEIVSTVPGGTKSKGGTSMAAPIVSAAVAHIKARFPDLTPDEIEDALTTTASDHPNRGDDFGFGVIDPLAAIEKLHPPPPPAQPPTPPDTIPNVGGGEGGVTIAAGQPAQGHPDCTTEHCRHLEITILPGAPEGPYTVECFTSNNPNTPWHTATWHWPTASQWIQGGCIYNTPGDQIWATVSNQHGTATSNTITWPTTTTPQPPQTTTTYSAVSAGGGHSCGLRTDGTITCWGANFAGQAEAPEAVYTAVSAGVDHSCGLRTDGSITCWGHNGNGQAEAPEGVHSAVSAGWRHSCGLRSDGTITCWGANVGGRAEAPEGVYTAVSAGGGHSCGLRSDGTITCWGHNDNGQTEAPAGTHTTVAAGWSHSCGLRSDGTVTCWGWNHYGQADAPAGQYTAVSARGEHSCGLRSDGTITCWGENSLGQADAPAGRYTAVSAGENHSCGLRTDGTISCWGFNEWGQADVPGGTSGPAADRIAFVRGGDIWVIKADGENEQRLTTGREPSWSPDGLRIVYTIVDTASTWSIGSTEIYGNDAWRIDVDGSNRSRLTSPPNYVVSPQWSPVGDLIVYTRVDELTDPPWALDYTHNIWTMNADGTSHRQLTADVNWQYDPAWAPDGTQIVFATNDFPTNNHSNIWVMNVDGTNKRQLTSNSDWEHGPVWSPDGTKIAYERAYLDENLNLTDIDIWIMDSDGSNQQRLTTTDESEYRSSWSADGRHIAYQRGSAIWIMEADGSNQRRIVASGVDPAWSPADNSAPFRPGSGDEPTVTLFKGGLGPTELDPGQGVPCGPNTPTCRYLDVELAGFAPGAYTVSCAHDGWGQFGPSVFWTFSVTVDAGGSAVSRGPCFLNFERLIGNGAYVSVTGPDGESVASNWLK